MSIYSETISTECPKNNNDELKNILQILGVSVFFTLSEIMPFIKKVKSNGLIDLIVNYLKNSTTEEYSRLPEENIEESTEEEI